MTLVVWVLLQDPEILEIAGGRFCFVQDDAESLRTRRQILDGEAREVASEFTRKLLPRIRFFNSKDGLLAIEPDGTVCEMAAENDLKALFRRLRVKGPNLEPLTLELLKALHNTHGHKDLLCREGRLFRLVLKLDEDRAFEDFRLEETELTCDNP